MSSKKERGRARSDGDDGRTGLDWVLNGVPNEVDTDDRATSVAADGDGGRNTPCVWLDVGNVDDVRRLEFFLQWVSSGDRWMFAVSPPQTLSRVVSFQHVCASITHRNLGASDWEVSRGKLSPDR